MRLTMTTILARKRPDLIGASQCPARFWMSSPDHKGGADRECRAGPGSHAPWPSAYQGASRNSVGGCEASEPAPLQTPWHPSPRQIRTREDRAGLFKIVAYKQR